MSQPAPARAPSRQTGAIVIRHYDEGVNPFSGVDALLAAAEAPKSGRERLLHSRFLLRRIQRERKVDSSVAAEATPLSTRAPQQPFGGDKGVREPALIDSLRLQLNQIDAECHGEVSSAGMPEGANINIALYRNIESEVSQVDAADRWRDAVALNKSIAICGCTIGTSFIREHMQPDGSMPLHGLILEMYGRAGLHEEDLRKVALEAHSSRRFNKLSFNSGRDLHRFFGAALKKFSKSVKEATRSHQPGLNRAEFCTFAQFHSLMSPTDAGHIFDTLAVESARDDGRVFTVDEFAKMLSM